VPEIGTPGLTSGDGKRGVGHRPQATAPILDSTISDLVDARLNRGGSVLCSAYSATLEFDNGWVDRSNMSYSKDQRLLLFRADRFNAAALGVLREIGDGQSLVAILDLNSDVFDIMPAELRAHSEVCSS
jgi:c-di-GMP phosphodiesterase